jgi:hypothetical protein
MERLKGKILLLSNKKVPALALVVVALAGMVAGVLAASMTVSQAPFQGEQGNYHNNTGAFTVTDNGLVVIANTFGNNATTMQVPSSGNTDYRTGTTAGNWAESLTFQTTLFSAGNTGHTVTVTFRSGGSAVGNSLQTYSGTIKEPTASSTGTVTLYIDLGTQSITSPVTAYVTVS